MRGTGVEKVIETEEEVQGDRGEDGEKDGRRWWKNYERG